jgi:hypothetical protein
MGMASDIGLILGSEHRDLLVLADRCGRVSRGFQDPGADLARRLVAHLVAAEAEVYSCQRAPDPPDLADLRDAVERVDAALGSGAAERAELALVARGLGDVERGGGLPVLAARLPIAERRRMGRVFRIRRDAVLRGAHSRPNRQRSQSELYELARRAGVERRSTMTQAQLQAAVAQWERQSGPGMQDAG